MTERERERERLIREYVAEGYSANMIQRELQKKGLGLRRKVLLAKIREVKGVPKKPHPSKYIPRKYRRVEVKPVPKREIPFLRERIWGKRLAVYGTVRGRSRRIEMYGSGRELYNAMLDAVIHPPRERFVICHARDVAYYLDYGDEWDERPMAVS